MTTPILTDAKGRPVERPERPARDASLADRLAFIRAMNAYHDRVHDLANRAFAKAFKP